MGRSQRRKVLQFVDDLVSVGMREATAFGLDDATAKALMTRVAHELCFLYGRTSIYVPAALDLTLSPRDEALWAAYAQDSATARKFTMARIDELAAEYKLTQRQAYNILSLMRTREVADRQNDMFAEGSQPSD